MSTVDECTCGEKTRNRMCYRMRKAEQARSLVGAYVDLLKSAISRRNWEEADKLAAKLECLIKEQDNEKD